MPRYTKIAPDGVNTPLPGEFSDTEPTGPTMETTPEDLRKNLNNIHTMLKEFSGSSNWYTRPADDADLFQTTKANARQVFAFRTTELSAEVTVSASQNYQVLSVGDSEAPPYVASVDVSQTEGAVVSHHTGTFGTHSLDAVAGSDVLRPVNLCNIIEASTGQPLVSSNDFEIKALLQSESDVDGHTFDDASNRVQLSFVERNAAGTDLVAVPIADIEGQTINYAFVRRSQYQNLPEWVLLTEGVSVGSGVVPPNLVSRDRSVAVVLSDISAGTDVTGAGASPNLDAQLGDYSGLDFVEDVNVFVNGDLQRNGEDSLAGFDVYPGTSSADGDLRFEYDLREGSVIVMEIYTPIGS